LEGLAPNFRLPGTSGLRNQGDDWRPRWRSMPVKRVAPFTRGIYWTGYETRSSTSHFLPSCPGDRSGVFPYDLDQPPKGPCFQVRVAPSFSQGFQREHQVCGSNLFNGSGLPRFRRTVVPNGRMVSARTVQGVGYERTRIPGPRPSGQT